MTEGLPDAGLCKEFIVHIRKTVVTNDQCGQNGMTSGALARLLEETASDDMDRRGLNVKEMKKKGLLWILISREVRTRGLPKEGTELEIYTWMSGKKHGLYPRYFLIKDKEGSTVAEASDMWGLLDKDSRKLDLCTELCTNDDEDGNHDLKMTPAWRVKFPELKEKIIKTVTENEIDGNGHVNNAIYLDWAEEILGENSLENNELDRLWIFYEKELLEGETAEIEFTRFENTLYVKGSIENETAFSLKLEYKNKIQS